MLNFLKKIFAPPKRDPRFPRPSANGKITIDGGTITYKSKDNYRNGTVILDQVKYVYIIFSPNDNSANGTSIHLRSDTQYWLPADASGFQEAYQFCAQKFGFDETIFFATLNSDKEMKTELWRAPHPTNFEIITTPNPNDIVHGFEILSPGKEFITWDATFDSLSSNKNISVKDDKLGYEKVEFKFPVRLGNIVTSEFAISFYSEVSSTPLNSGHATFFLENERQKGFALLRNAFEEMFGPESEEERADHEYHLSSRREVSGIVFSITYWKDCENGFDSASTSFSIDNEREYSHLIENEDYENKMSSDILLVIPFEAWIPTSSRSLKYVKTTPQSIQKEYLGKTVIWFDKTNNTIGFAVNEYSVIFDKSLIQKVELGNTLPAKGSGYSRFCIELGRGYVDQILGAGCNDLDPYLSDLEKILGMKIEILPEDHDC